MLLRASLSACVLARFGLSQLELDFSPDSPAVVLDNNSLHKYPREGWADFQTSRGARGNDEVLEHNWAGNVEFKGTPVVPASLAELQDAVRSTHDLVRVVGRGHSYSPLSECAGGTLLSLAKLNRVLSFREPTFAVPLGSITIEGGATYTDIIQFLGRRGALRNLASCPQFTVAGAIATGKKSAKNMAKL